MLFFLLSQEKQTPRLNFTTLERLFLLIRIQVSYINIYYHFLIDLSLLSLKGLRLAAG